MQALIRDAQALPKVTLPEYEPLEHVHTGHGVASNHSLLEIYQKRSRATTGCGTTTSSSCCSATART